MSNSQIRSTYTFNTRNDDFSFQVSCDQDPKFWFRLEQGANCDRITDFFLGAFDSTLGGDLLEACYKKIGHKPQRRIVFTDIVSSRTEYSSTVDKAKTHFEECARLMLANYGLLISSANIIETLGKFNLEIET